ncbi:MAG: hypothetical protein MI746_07380, partial [Pseudomonadales bacterium]|nr:hypothetical protein [Pseudomonadales bacterium]
MDRFDADGTRLPIKIDSTSNGEYEPIPIDKVNEQGNKLAFDNATEHAKHKAQSRRQFLISSCGAASTLLAMNQANAYHGRTGGFFDVREESALDDASALAEVGGGEFIFDVQGHYVNPEGDWLSRIPPDARPYAGMEKASCDAANTGGDRGYLGC